MDLSSFHSSLSAHTHLGPLHTMNEALLEEVDGLQAERVVLGELGEPGLGEPHRLTVPARARLGEFLHCLDRLDRAVLALVVVPVAADVVAVPDLVVRRGAIHHDGKAVGVGEEVGHGLRGEEAAAAVGVHLEGEAGELFHRQRAEGEAEDDELEEPDQADARERLDRLEGHEREEARRDAVALELEVRVELPVVHAAALVRVQLLEAPVQHARVVALDPERVERRQEALGLHQRPVVGLESAVELRRRARERARRGSRGAHVVGEGVNNVITSTSIMETSSGGGKRATWTAKRDRGGHASDTRTATQGGHTRV